MVCRNADKGRAAQTEIRSKSGNSDVELFVADLAEMKDVRRIASELDERHPAIHVLVNNAGGLIAPRRETSDGLEAMFAGNYLGHFLLTMSLLGKLERSGGARIINVSSIAHEPAHIDFGDLQLTAPGKGMRGYGQSKLAQILFTYELAERLTDSDVTVNVLHPGVVRSRFNDGVPPKWRPLAHAASLFSGISPEQGADTILYLAMSQDVSDVTGKYFIKRRPRRSSKLSYNRAVQRRLFEQSEKILASV